MNTQDILNLTLSACAAILTIGLTYIIINLSMIIRRVRKTIDLFTGVVLKIGDLAEFVKEKFTHTSTYIPMFVEGVKKVIDLVEDRRKK